MILVLSHEGDGEAEALTAAWSAHGACLWTPRDLSRPGLVHRPGAVTDDVVIASGQTISTRDIRAVLGRLDAVRPEELGHVIEEDRAYVAAEMTATLRSILTSLACKVVHRPVHGCLGGPLWLPEQWVELGRRAGVRLCTKARSARPETNAWLSGASPANVVACVVIGERVFGSAPAVLEEATLALARASATPVVVALFDAGAEGPAPALLHVSPFPPLHDAAVREALLGLLLGDCP